MNIGQAATKAGTSAKTIRYYESIGLIPAPPRTESGYRDYGMREVETLRFVARARSLGFSIEDVSALLELYRDHKQPASEVRRIAEVAISRIESKLTELQSMHRTLSHLVHQCQHGAQGAHGKRPDCPILDDLSSTGRHDHGSSGVEVR